MQDTQDYTGYHVEEIKPSASAIIIFTHHPQTRDAIVLKILREILDERYDLSTVEKRQQCQVEALIWNPKFTSGIYLGLAPINETLEDLQRKMDTAKEIGVGSVLDNPEESAHLLKDKEYALLMRWLPEHRRLDTLLEANKGYKRDEPIPSYLLMLLKRICAIHKDHTSFPAMVTDESGVNKWGSVEQLRKKLEENLAWLEKSLGPQLIPGSDLSHTCTWMKEVLQESLNTQKYQAFFESRLQGHHIKRCHGDLKADNIWIEPDDLEGDEQPETSVRMLDCIDFKSSFCVIDTLSDIALLVADIQARAGNVHLADAVVDEYLRLTGEDEEAARYLLAYYLVEKAAIGMVNSYIDDNKEELGRSYKDVVDQRLSELISRIQRSK
jgi:aminoglycoside phosphotransferase family enzyme